MNDTTKSATARISNFRAFALRTVGMFLFLALALGGSAHAQWEKTVLIGPSQWKDFFGLTSITLPFASDFRTYNIAFEHAYQVGAPADLDYRYVLSGVQIQSECEESWVAGPFNFQELLAHVQTTQARMIDIEKVTEPGLQGDGPWYFVVMTPNKGSQAKGWSWLVGVSIDDIRQHEDEYNLRVIDLEILHTGSYAAIFIANVGKDERDTFYGTETSQEDIDALVAWGADDYRLVHIGYEGNSTGEGGVSWNYIFEKTNEIGFAYPVFDATPAQLQSLAFEKDHRISMIDYNRYNSLNAAILVEQLP